MNLIVNYFIKHMKKSKWSDIEIMKMELGFHVLLHNILMISCILVLAFVLNILKESVLLMIGFGLLKLTAGGIHLKNSFLCILCTSIFIISGVTLAKYIVLPFWVVLLIYGVCMLILWIIGPQGTENNPISDRNYYRLRREMMRIMSIYLLITIYKFTTGEKAPNLLLVAIVFETITISMSTMIKRKYS